MRLDHLLLQWLSIEQALENLRGITKQPISEDDLLSLCEEGFCSAYLKASGVEGKTEVAMTDETPQCVYGAGYQRILNATLLRRASHKAPIRLNMVGPVFSDQADDFEERTCAWEASVAQELLSIRFKTSEIQTLAATITGNSGKGLKLDLREKKSVWMLIALLAKMADIDLSQPYSIVEALRAAAALHGLELPESDETIVKFLQPPAPPLK